MPSEKRVLVADDDHAIRQLLCTLIKREGLSVDCVADGVEAIAKLEERNYYVILLDLMMPNLDGFAVIQHLAEHPQEPKPIVFIISAYADQTFKQVDPHVVGGVIHKPFDVIALGELVRHCVLGYDPELGRIEGVDRYAPMRAATSRAFARGEEQS
jgi:two-component system, response regulator, stage 0 sporulation protein F